MLTAALTHKRAHLHRTRAGARAKPHVHATLARHTRRTHVDHITSHARNTSPRHDRRLPIGGYVHGGCAARALGGALPVKRIPSLSICPTMAPSSNSLSSKQCSCDIWHACNVKHFYTATMVRCVVRSIDDPSAGPKIRKHGATPTQPHLRASRPDRPCHPQKRARENPQSRMAPERERRNTPSRTLRLRSWRIRPSKRSSGACPRAG